MFTTHSHQSHPYSSRRLTLLLLLAFTPMVAASPLFSIGHGQTTSWTDAAPNLRVAGEGGSPGAVDPNSAAYQFYQTAIGQDMFGTPVSQVLAAENVQLFPVDAVSDGSQSFDSLVMTWQNNEDTNGNVREDVLNVAAWDYVYDVDPDLTGLEIKFSILPPPGVWDFSLELYDEKGSSIGWFGVPPGTSWQSVVIDPGVQAPQGPFSHFFAGANPGGLFELDKVAFLRLNESSQGGVSFMDFPAPGGLPPGTVIPSGQPWNAWNHLTVTTPEPPSVMLFLVAVAGLMLARTRSRQWLRRS